MQTQQSPSTPLARSATRTRALPMLPQPTSTMTAPPQRMPSQRQPPGPRPIPRQASESALRQRVSQRTTGRRRTSSSLAKATFLWIRGELIGKGSYGRVYMGMNVTTGDIMAVKQVEIPRSAFGSHDARQQEVLDALRSENETLKHLDHPNIVQYLGIEETAEFLSIFLEYVPGGTIKACLNNHGPFPEEITKSFGKQILTGLEYLHSRGIIHRDLKSENILVEPTGECKISDFGISKTANTPDIDKHTALKGTIFWMAPEVVKGNRGYNSKADIWSVGCIVLEMWTGARPWQGEEMVPVMLKLYDGKVPPMPSDSKLSSAARDFRARCFTLDPIERPAAADLKRHPYLRLPNNWVFPGFGNDRRSTAEETSETLRPPDERTVRPFVASPEDDHTHIHFRRPTIDSVADDTFFQHRSTPPPMPPVPNDAGPSRPRNEGPPIVVVEPSRTPDSNRSSDYDSLHRYRTPSESSSTSTRRRRRRKWVVANPDPEGPAPAFTYTPPPLPESPPPRRTPSAPPRTPTPSPPPPPDDDGALTFRAFSDRLGMRFRDAPASAQSTMLSSEADDEGTDASMWQVRPAASPAPAASPIPAASPAPAEPALARSASTWARPTSQAVYQDLNRFFPDHDLDQPLDVVPEVASTEDLAGRNMRVRKSIRVIAAEHSKADRLNRRRTQLWGSNIHELPSH